MRRTVLVTSAVTLVCFGWLGPFVACGQIGGTGSPPRPGAARSPATPGGSAAPSTPNEPGSRFGSGAPGSRFGSEAPGAATGPAAGGAFTPLDSSSPSTIPPPTTPPPVRAPENPGADSTIPATGAGSDAGGGSRFGAPPAGGSALPPASTPDSASPRLDDPSFAPIDPTSPDSRYGSGLDPLRDDRGARPSDRGAMPLDDERTLPGFAAPGPDTGAAPLPPPGAAAPAPAEYRRLTKMIYRNELATFFLVLDQGSAHYHLQHQQAAPPQLQPIACIDGHCLNGGLPMPSYLPHLATLEFEENNDSNYWHYVARDGDEFTVEWAFAKRPSRDGGYAIYRQTREGWARYGSFSRQALR